MRLTAHKRERPAPGAGRGDEIASLRDQLERSEEHTARALMRATRLSQVISILGNEKDLESTAERVAIEVGELFFADLVLLMLASDEGLSVAGHWGVADSDLPVEPFTLPDVEEATNSRSVRIGPAADTPLPDWLARYAPRHLAWARLLVGDQSLGLMLLGRCGDEPFEDSEATELRAVAYRVTLAIENRLLHKGMQNQLAQLHRLQQLTAALAGTLDIEAVGARIAETLVSEAAASSSVVLINRPGALVVLSRAGATQDLAVAADGTLVHPLDDHWTTFPLQVGAKVVGMVAVADAPAVDSEQHQLLLHLLSLGALSIDKALLHEHSREQARHDSLTGLLGHRVFHEMLEAMIADAIPFSVLLFDIDDFKQVNDLHGHQTGDQALRLVADALQQATRNGDSVFRTGGEEFFALLPGLTEEDAFGVAEGVRQKVSAIVSGLPNAVTISAGVASFPAHASQRDELLAVADAALYASKRAGKNRTTIAGRRNLHDRPPSHHEVGLDLLQNKDPDTLSHSIQVAILAVELARALALGDDRLDDLRTAARLHDIGKIGVPDAIIHKREPLDAEEVRIVETHPVIGGELLEAWGLPVAASIVRQHHEHVDGSGYPAGLRGDEICIESRIVHAADAYVAMTRDRPYRKALARDKAFAELVRHSGTQFDPDIVDALIALERARPPGATTDIEARASEPARASDSSALAA